MAITPNVLVADAADDSVGPGRRRCALRPPDQEAKPKTTVDDQLNKAVEVLKSRAS